MFTFRLEIKKGFVEIFIDDYVIGPDYKKRMGVNCDYFLIQQFKHLFCMLKRTSKSVLLCTHNICFLRGIGKLFF